MPEIFEGVIVLGICGVGIVVLCEVCLFFYGLSDRLKKRRRKNHIRFLDD